MADRAALRRRLLTACLAAVALAGLASAQSRVYIPPTTPYSAEPANPLLGSLQSELISECQEMWRNTTLDHFSWAIPPRGVTKFQQRYFVCDKHWTKDAQGQKGPIFFYAGNEASVTLYLNSTGLMWESAPKFGALIVFAEHRYYGESKPYENPLDHPDTELAFLTSEQAMADYANIIQDLKKDLDCHDSPVIAFGGSYGGMLAAYMRMKYPHLVDGAIAASAPIWTFFGESPPYDVNAFAKVVSRDASAEGGSAPACSGNVHATWPIVEGWAKNGTAEQKAAVRSALRLCPHATTDKPEEVDALLLWLQKAWDYMAMGNFPYATGYILNNAGVLPAYPMRAACKHLAQPDLEGEELLSAFADAVGVFYNHSDHLPCFDYKQGSDKKSDDDFKYWVYQWCTELVQPFGRDGEGDMFWPQPYDWPGTIEYCQQTYKVTPRKYWMSTEYGGKALEGLTNVVFTNGLLDPWSGGGVLKSMSPSVVAIIIPEGAHHVDLMFTNPEDPPSLTRAREVQRTNIQQWIVESRVQRRQNDRNAADASHPPRVALLTRLAAALRKALA